MGWDGMGWDGLGWSGMGKEGFTLGPEIGWGWRKGGRKARGWGNHPDEHGESLVKCGGSEKEERKRKKTFLKEKWTEPGDWLRTVEQFQPKFQERGCVTVTRWKTRCYTGEVLRMTAFGGWFGGWEGPGPLRSWDSAPSLYTWGSRGPRKWSDLSEVTKLVSRWQSWDWTRLLSAFGAPSTTDLSICPLRPLVPHFTDKNYTMQQATWLWPLQISKYPELQSCWTDSIQDLPEDKPALSFPGEPSSGTVFKFLVNLRATE